MDQEEKMSSCLKCVDLACATHPYDWQVNHHAHAFSWKPLQILLVETREVSSGLMLLSGNTLKIFASFLFFNASFGSAHRGAASSRDECVCQCAQWHPGGCVPPCRVSCVRTPSLRFQHHLESNMNIPGEVCKQGRSEKKRSRAQEKQPFEKSLQQLLAMPPTRHKTTEDKAREDAAPGQATPTQLDSNRVQA